MAKDRYLQAVRGVAIAAVVLIHCLPQCDASVVLRPLLNWAVAAFLFLSGLLTTEARIARGGVSLWFCQPWRPAFSGMTHLDAGRPLVRRVVRAPA